MKIRASIAVLLILSTPGAVEASSGRDVAETSVSALESQIVHEINVVRTRRGLPRVRLSTALLASSRFHSTEMARRGFFSHRSVNGTRFDVRIARFYPRAGRRTWLVGENLMWGSPSVDAAEVVSLWLASPTHRVNVLDRRWREVGIGAVNAAAAPGVFDGLDVTVVTADFGIRK